MRKNKRRPVMKELVNNIDVTRQYEENMTERIWRMILKTCSPNLDYLSTFQNHYNWTVELKVCPIPEDTLRLIVSLDSFKEYEMLYWDRLCGFQTLSEEFIKEFQDKVNWKLISSRQKLSEEFIKEFQDKVDWKRISHHQELSEDFIREFENLVDWFEIAKYQKISKEFVENYRDRLLTYRLRENKHFSRY